jgi:hypothetical protein
MTPERRRLLQAAAAASLAGTIPNFLSRALAAGSLPSIPGVNTLVGTAKVNGKDAKVGTPVAMGDKVSTGAGSYAVIVLSKDAFLVRADSTVEFNEANGVLGQIKLTAGKMLSVFAPRRMPLELKTANATIGIRGTGAYAEILPGRDYFCLCYGEAAIDGKGMASPKMVKTTHHESPLYLVEGKDAMKVEPGPFLNHTDAELIMLEALVGREPPFIADGQYPAKRY